MDVEGDMIRQFLAILVVLGLLAAAVWKLRGAAPMAGLGGKRISPVARVTLTPHHAIHLIRVDNRELVIATHPQGCTILATETATAWEAPA